MKKRHDNHKKILKQFYNTVWLYLLKTNLTSSKITESSNCFQIFFRRVYWYIKTAILVSIALSYPKLWSELQICIRLFPLLTLFIQWQKQQCWKILFTCLIIIIMIIMIIVVVIIIIVITIIIVIIIIICDCLIWQMCWQNDKSNVCKVCC